MYMATLRNAGGQRVFPNVGALGGDILGVPLLVSPGAGSNLILLDADAILVADGGLELGNSNQATIEMSDAPSGDSTTGTGAAPSSRRFKRRPSRSWQPGASTGSSRGPTAPLSSCCRCNAHEENKHSTLRVNNSGRRRTET